MSVSARTRILLLEDDEGVRDLLLLILGAEGYEITVCRTAAEVRSRAAVSQDPCLALADPWGDSHSVLDENERLQILDLARAVPMILLTARGWAAQTAPGDLGLRDLLIKPFEIEELLVRIRRSAAQVAEEAEQTGSQSLLPPSTATEELDRLGEGQPQGEDPADRGSERGCCSRGE